ncbi:sulfotransferase [Donghicola sp. C2-DW-16]|uniref:Sulfotransferase n=1 Tax=Donghicola mangrovi TaxID=2729614 RepID=A0ABX2PE34_9RHOB|nr:sulfotransferase [Donghicola mangrovi]NVO27746.1 sulfotransferase [Donghicola mangrovi]
MKYRLPNFLIVGAQKSGTSWLHRALGKSSSVFASEEKELNFFNKRDFASELEAYKQNFPENGVAEYYLETTPHYFQKSKDTFDIAANIKSCLKDPKIIVILRNPVDRYESAYVHHMMKGRIPYTQTIEEMTDQYKMLTLGHYSEILSHWQSNFPEIGVFFYDDLQADRLQLVASVLEYLGVENDIKKRELRFKANAKKKKAARLWDETTSIPFMATELRSRLVEYYADGIRDLQHMTGRDLSHWLVI